MNLRQIEVFRAVMQSASISEAARLLRVSQPNISRMLHYTEDQLGLRLFERTRGRLHPTPEANILFAEVEKAYRGVQIVNDVAKDLAESRVGRLRLVCSPSLGLALVPQAIAAYRAGREGLRISLEILSQAELIEAVLTHQANLGISMFPSDDPGLATETLGTGRLVCIMPAGHPLAAKHQVTPADLAAYPLISYHRDTQQGRVVEDALSEAHVSHDIAIEVRFGHTACALVQAGAGIALADEFSVMGTTFPEVVQRPFAPARNFAVSILRDRLRPASRAAEGFIAALRRINAGR